MNHRRPEFHWTQAELTELTRCDVDKYIGDATRRDDRL